MTGKNPRWSFNAAALESQFHKFFVGQAHSLSRGRADQRRVVPGETRVRLRQLLQPAIVNELSVVNVRVWPKDQLQSWRGGVRSQHRGLGSQSHGLRRQSRVRNEAIMK